MLLCSLLFPWSARASDLDDFKSDGCSLFPDGSLTDRRKWCDCCFTHDIAYWRGGTEAERKQADVVLKGCIRRRTGSRLLAGLMFMGVRTGGHPVFPTGYRWGFGWKYGRGYKPLTGQERAETDKKLAEYAKKHPAGFCAETETAR